MLVERCTLAIVTSQLSIFGFDYQRGILISSSSVDVVVVVEVRLAVKMVERGERGGSGTPPFGDSYYP